MNNRRLHLSGLMFDGIASGMMLMALPWSILSVGNNGTFLAIVTLVCTLLSFMFTPFFATAIDRYSRKHILAVSQLIQMLSAISVVVVSWFVGVNIWILASCLLVFWLASDLAWSTNGAFTQELYKPSEYGRVSSQQEIVMQVTTLSAGGMGVWLLEVWTIDRFAMLTSALTALALLCFMAIQHQASRKTANVVRFHQQLGESKRIFSQSPLFFLFIALSCLSYPMMTYLSKLVPIYLSENLVSGEWFAWWQINYGIGAMLCGLAIVKVMKRVRHEKLMVASMVMMCVLLAIMALTLSPLSIVLIALFMGLFNATNRIARVNKLHHDVDNSVRGRVDGGMKLFTTAAQSGSYILIAYLAHYQLIEVGFAVAALVMIAATLAMWMLKRANVLAYRPIEAELQGEGAV